MRFRGLIAAMMTVTSVFVVGCEKKITDEGTEYYIEADIARKAGDTTKAMELFGKSIETKPTPWAYYDRARLYLEQDNEAQAKADVTAGLKADPLHTELRWLAQELAKPKDKRFKGPFADPPTDRK